MPCEVDGTDSAVSDDFLDSCLSDMENMDRKPAAREDPIKDTPSLKSPITTSYIGKRLRQSYSEPTDMIPVDMRPIHHLSSITNKSFDTETLTKNLVVT